MDGVRSEVRDEEYSSNGLFSSVVDMMTEQDGRLGHIWSLSGGLAKIIDDVGDGITFNGCSLTTD